MTDQQRETDDDFAALRAALQQDAPAPNAARKAEILRLASENFAQRQDLSRAPRLNSKRGVISRVKFGVVTMLEKLSSKAMMGATASVAVIGVGVALIGQSPRQVLEPQGITAASDAVVERAAPPMPQMAPMPIEPSAKMRAHRAAPSQMPASNTFAAFEASGVKITREEPVSTFSVDVDTASWSWLRGALRMGQMPEAASVRIEEMVNYFPYAYSQPEGEEAFSLNLARFVTPWNAGTELVRIGLQGRVPVEAVRAPLNLVFLVDTSGSMQGPDRLGLLKTSFGLLLSTLQPEDQVAIIGYAGQAGEVLAPTPASERSKILAALDGLSAGGGTAGAEGLELAYKRAAQMQAEGEVARVILATDGDFNLGPSDPEALKRFVEERRKGGVSLSVLGFGRGNLNDALMQALAQNGNGQAAYIDSAEEAQKVMLDQAAGLLQTIASDVKIQVEWNPAQVAEYRLLGYETRALDQVAFHDDRVDAGEIGAGHQVTALYEITPVGSAARLSDPLRYGTEAASVSGETGWLKLRYKQPGESSSVLLEAALPEVAGAADDDAKFAAAIAGFGLILRGDAPEGWGYAEAIDLAGSALGEDRFGYRAGALAVMRLAKTLSGR